MTVTYNGLLRLINTRIILLWSFKCGFDIYLICDDTRYLRVTQQKHILPSHTIPKCWCRLFRNATSWQTNTGWTNHMPSYDRSMQEANHAENFVMIIRNIYIIMKILLYLGSNLIELMSWYPQNISFILDHRHVTQIVYINENETLPCDLSFLGDVRANTAHIQVYNVITIVPADVLPQSGVRLSASSIQNSKLEPSSTLAIFFKCIRIPFLYHSICLTISR